MTEEHEWMAARFEANRSHLRAVAYRMLGSTSEADDAVQEAWLRLSRADTSGVDNLAGWLTTVIARVCLDMLRARTSRREDPLDAGEFPPAARLVDGRDPASDAMLTDSVGLALLVVLDTLAPAERLAFVLHDVFAMPFEEIAPIVERSPAATRQLASRARRRVRGASEDGRVTDAARQREIVEAFFKASRGGDFQALLAALDPDVTLRADETVLRMGQQSGWITSDLQGADAVARQFAGRAEAAQLALIDGAPGAVWAPGGTPRVAFGFTIRAGKVAGITLTADPERLNRMEIEILR